MTMASDSGDSRHGQLPPLSGLPPVSPHGPGNSDSSDSATFSVRQYTDILRRRRLLIAVVALTTVVITVVQVFTTTPLYRAAAILEIEPQAKIVPYQDVGAALVDPSDMATQIRLLQGSNVLDGVVETLDLTQHPSFKSPPSDGFFVDLGSMVMRIVKGRFRTRDPETAPTPRWVQTKLKENLAITPIRNTRLISVRYLAPDPALAAEIANEVADEFVRQSMESRYDARGEANRFLNDRLAELKISIQDSEAKLIDYARQKDLALSSNDTSSQRRVDEFVSQQTEADAEAEQFRGYWEALKGGRLDMVPAEVKTEELRVLESQLARKQQEMATLSARYGPQWPSVRELRAEIEGLSSDIAGETITATEALRQRYLLARTRARSLGSRASSERQLAAKVSEDTVQFDILRRETEANKQLYESMLQRLKETDIVSQLEQGGVRKSQDAVRPSSIFSPNKTQAVGMAVALGVALGIGAGLLREMLDGTVKTSEDVVRKVGLPALGAIAELGSKEQRKRGRSRASGPPPTLAFRERSDEAGRIRESYRAVRTSILLSTPGRPPKTLLVTSALPGEGKSTTVANLAVAFAQTGVRTLAIDLDLRKSTLGALLGIKSKEGMSAYLSGNTELASQLVETKYANLALLPAGAPPPNPVELIGSERMRSSLAMTGEHFGHILIDTPPALELSDAVVLSPYVDGVVLVARAEITAAEALKRTASRFEAAGARVLGVLLNCADLRGPEYGHYYARYGSARGGYAYSYGPPVDENVASER